MKLFITSLLLITFLPIHNFSQVSLKGIIKDSITGQPIQYVTIYENGTTNGTISNSEGKFKLEIESGNSEIIFSCVGYASKKRVFKEPANNITIQLVPVTVDLNAVDIVSSDFRKRNVEIFEKCFLGYDYWGENAILENQEALIFYPEYLLVNDSTEIKKHKKPDKKNQWIKNLQKMKKFEARAKGPLQIFLPLLGYHLHIDLINFKVVADTIHQTYSSEYIGYFYYSPDSIGRKSLRKKIKENRTKAYYNSPMHFCRSLFENKLLENGYIVYDTCNIRHKNIFSDPDSRFNIPINYPDSMFAEIDGLEGIELSVLYTDSYIEPIDLTKDYHQNLYLSKIKFKSNKVVIRKNGTIPNKLIMFRGDMGEKMVGASLPSNYEVGEN